MQMTEKQGAFLDQVATGHIVLNDGQGLCSLAVAGDLCPIRRVEALLVDRLFAEVWGKLPEILRDADVSVVNLECPLTDSNSPIFKTGPNLRADPHCAEGIRAGGFDVVTLANNHALDMGPRGLIDTLKHCAQAGLQSVGAGRDIEEATRPLLVTRDDLTIAILNFAEHEWSIAQQDRAGAAPLDLIENYRMLQQARDRADYVLVVLHGGNEHYALPSPRLVKTCRYFVEVGAHAVICHHAHVPSGLEVYQGTPIVYGTGNLLFDWPGRESEGWYMGYVVRLNIGRGRTTSMSLLPYHQCVHEAGVCIMSKAEKTEFLDIIVERSAIIANSEELREYWMNFCAQRRQAYQSSILCLRHIERKLAQRGVWPWWRTSKEQARRLLNLVRCESHRDILIQALNDV